MRHHLLSATMSAAASEPSRIAIDGPGERVSYGKLAGAVSEVVAILCKGRLAHDRGRVAVQLPRGATLYAATIAIWHSGRSVVPLTMRGGTVRNLAIVRAVHPSALLTANQDPPEGTVESIRIDTEVGRIYAHLRDDVAHVPADEMYVVSTSGSTGLPKCIPIHEGALAQFYSVARQRFPVASGDRCTQLFEATFDLFYYDLLMTIGAGACLVPIPREKPWSALETCARYGVTKWFSVPTMGELLARSGALDVACLPNLNEIKFCGEPLTTRLAEEWQRRFPTAAVHNLYGPAEATIACSSHRLTGKECGESLVPIGEVFSGLHHRIVPTGDGTGRAGELQVAGAQVMRGYIDAGRTTAEAFDETEERSFYRTGDLVQPVAVGGMIYVGRVDRQFKFRGIRIQPESIEAAVRTVHGVHQASLVVESSSGVATAHRLFWCTDTKQPGGDAAEFESRMKEVIASTLSPAHLPTEFVQLDRLPLSDSGKIDARAMRNGSNVETNLIPKSICAARRLVASALSLSYVPDNGRIHELSGWDSLGHVSVVMALSRELGKEVRPESCLSVSDVRSLMKSRAEAEPRVHRGLHGVYLDRSAICEVAGARGGTLVYRERTIRDLISAHSFEQVAAFLGSGLIPDKNEAVDYLLEGGHRWSANRRVTLDLASISIALLSEESACENAMDDPCGAALRLMGMLLRGTGISQDSLRHGVAHSLLATFVPSAPDRHSEILDSALVVLAEHGAAASTTALRCAASTGCSAAFALAASIGAFSGPRHGGAITEVAERYFKNGTDINWQQPIKPSAAGFGHRVYLGPDPRCLELREMIEAISAGSRIADGLATLESTAREQTGNALFPNVDMYAAALLYLLGVPTSAMSSVFAIGRLAGWVAHLLEQRLDNVLIRPKLLYVPSAAQEGVHE